MKKYSKKIALILALALTLAIAIPVLAANEENEERGGTTQITGSYLSGASTIDITMPNSKVVAFLNPSATDAYLIDKDNKLLTSLPQLEAKGHITTMPITCKNNGTSNVNVYAKVTGDLKIHKTTNGAATITGNNFRFSTALPKTTSTNGYIYLEAKAVKAADIDGMETTVKTLNDWAVVATTSGGAKKLSTAEAKTRVLLKTTTTSCTEPMCTIEGAGTDKKNAMVARLVGWIGTNPTGLKRWSSSDGFKTTIAWTFELPQ